MEFCQHNTYISLLPTSFFLHVDYLHRVVLWPPMSSLIIMNNIKQKRFIIKLFCTKQARHLYNITCQQENSAENREGKIINQKIYGTYLESPLLDFLICKIEERVFQKTYLLSVVPYPYFMHIVHTLGILYLVYIPALHHA